MITKKDNMTIERLAHHELFKQLVNKEILNYLQEYPTLITRCKDSTDYYYNDIKLSTWNKLGSICWNWVNLKKCKELNINNSPSSKVCLVKCAMRVIVSQ